VKLLRNTRRAPSKLALALVLLFIIPMATPLVGSTTGQTSGRAAPDFGVTELTFSGAGSIDRGNGIYLEPVEHDVRVVVRNTGDLSGSATLQLVHKGSPTAGEYVVTTISLGTIPSQTTSNTIIIPWTATTGDAQTLFARISGAGDSNPANNEQRKDFDVKNNHSGIVTGENFPQLASGQQEVAIYSNQTFVASVRNAGVKSISGVMKMELVNGSTTHTYWSNTQILQPGSLFAPSSSEDLTIPFNPTGFTGTWDMTFTVVFNGTVPWDWKPEFPSITIRFSNYSASLSSLGDRSIEPGQTGTLTYLLKNTGSVSDSYEIQSITALPASRLSWLVSSAPAVGDSTPMISQDSTTSITLTVAIPLDENRSNATMFTMTVKSNSGAYHLVTAAVVQAGESYRATIEMPNGTQMLKPGEATSLVANVTNSGNVGAEFTFGCGLSVAAVNWELDISGAPCSSFSTYINRSQTIQIPISIKVPPIDSPLNPGEFNLAGQPLQVWLQAQATGGGVPTQSSSDIEVTPIIVIDPGLPSDGMTLTVEEVIAARNGQGLEEIIPLDVEVRHNLYSNIEETLDAEITVNTSFVAANTGGFTEMDRWDAVVSPQVMTGLKPGNNQPAILSLQGPDDDYPLAGTLTLSLTVVPNLGSTHTGSGVLAAPVTRNFSVIIPTVHGADILEDGPVDVMVGVTTPIAFQLANTGNDLTAYRLRAFDIPTGWTVEFNGTSDTIDNISADVADHPLVGAAHMTTVEMLITTDPYVPANSIIPLTLTVEERDTGFLITEHILPIRVGEVRNASLFPLTQPLELSPTDVGEFTTIKITNTGNSPATFYVYLDNSEAGDVIFELDSNPSMLIAPNIQDIIKVRATPTSLASADRDYVTTIFVADSSGVVNLSANITANITQSSDIRIEGPPIVPVTPGEMMMVEFNVTNIGNLQESVLVAPTVEGDWSTDVTEIGMTLTINQTITGQVVVNVPSLGGETNLMDGSIHNLTISVYDAETSAFKTSIVIQMRVGALFSLEAEDWPTEMEFYRQGTRTWDVTLLNTGNRDVAVAVEYSILRPGLTVNSTDWVLNASAPSTLFLPVGVAVQHTFTIEAVNFEPDLSTTADFEIFYTPTDASVDGDAAFATQLTMSRFFTTGDIILRPQVGDPPLDIDLTYSHIPDGQATSVAYELELCDVDRMLDFAPLNLNEADYPWSFTIVLPDANNTEIPLPLSSVSCNLGTQGEAARITLPTRAAWDTTDPIQVRVQTPARPNILSGDGWDLKFRLYHPTENNGYTNFDEETFRFALDVFADPMIESLETIAIEEGEEFELLLTVVNAGTATALGVDVELVCPHSTILISPSQDPMIGVLGPGDKMVLNWRIQPDSIDWWLQSLDSSCTATVDAFYMDKNVEENDVRVIELDVESSSPGVSTSFIALILCFLASFILLRLTGQNEKYRLLAVYAGVLGFGFSFHILDFAYWGFSVLILAALWIWRMSWASSEEFKLIHEDYQRARRGVSTLYADHFDALRDSRRQLSVILAVPVLGFVAVVLGLPPQLYADQANMVSILVYITVVMLGVWMIILRADRAYGNLYGRLTDIEVKATRIERDLGDPARLFNELAGDGLDLDEIFGDLSSNATVGSIIASEPEEVNEDA